MREPRALREHMDNSVSGRGISRRAKLLTLCPFYLASSLDVVCVVSPSPAVGDTLLLIPLGELPPAMERCLRAVSLCGASAFRLSWGGSNECVVCGRVAVGTANWLLGVCARGCLASTVQVFGLWELCRNCV